MIQINQLRSLKGTSLDQGTKKSHDRFRSHWANAVRLCRNYALWFEGGYQGGYLVLNPEEKDSSAEPVEELLESMDEELSLEDSTDFDYEAFLHMVRKNNCNNINNW